ncbi:MULTISPECIES: hypothetical protein [unclassified Clostridium]|uniref:hypothetical protein n=1 Tax=unclassified Clostridium TaxID=2614128 RepID=UPI00207A38B4|nr:MULTISPECIES: hypothetical protein [unclassified Clostridium]
MNYNVIYEQFKDLKTENKVIISNVIVNAIQPLITLKHDKCLINLYNYYLNKLFENKTDKKELYREYKIRVEKYFSAYYTKFM